MSEKAFMELVNERSPNTLPHYLPSNYRGLVTHKKVTITSYYLKDTAYLNIEFFPLASYKLHLFYL